MSTLANGRLLFLASRGNILDRNGAVIASSYTTYDVYVRPADVTDLSGVALLLSTELELDYNNLLDKSFLSHSN